MTLPAFSKIQFTAASVADLCRQLSAFAGSVTAYFDRIRANPSVDRLLISQASLAGAADTVIAHRLNRTPQEYRLGRVTAAATIYWVAWDDKTITLHASAACSADVEVW